MLLSHGLLSALNPDASSNLTFFFLLFTTTTTMPRNRRSNDVDHVPIDPEGSSSKKSKQTPPSPWPLPAFDAMDIKKPLTHGRGRLPRDIHANKPYEVFGLFFDDGVLELIASCTNKYAAGELARIKANEFTPHARAWKPTTKQELRTYLGIIIWIGIHKETSMKDFWRQNTRSGPTHLLVIEHIALNRFEQLSRFLHVSDSTNFGVGVSV